MALHEDGELLKTRPTTGEHQTLGGDGKICPPLDGLDAMIVHSFKAHDLGAAFQIGLYRCEKGHLAAALALTTGLLTAQKRIINLDAPGQDGGLLTLEHDLHEFVANQPCAGIAHPEMAHQGQRSDAALAWRHPEHG